MISEETSPLQQDSTDNAAPAETYFSEVLLIEDDPAHARLIKRALKPIAGNFHHAPTGKQAIEMMYSVLPDVILCDLHLPDMNSVDLLSTIREIRPLTPVIVLTSSSDPGDAVQSMQAGAWDYMVKQFSDDLPHRLRFVFGRLLQRQRELLREQELLAERRAFSAATEAARDGVAILDGEGIVKFANDPFKIFLQHLSSEMLNGRLVDGGAANLVDAIATQDYRVANAFRETISKPGSSTFWSSEIPIANANPTEKDPSVYYELTLTSVRQDMDESSRLGSTPLPRVNEFIVWATDITRRKETERFQRDLLSTTSHDLKGPLGAIISSAELLSDIKDLPPDKAQDLITRIASCARGCITLIDELLSARRIQDGMLVVKPVFESASEVLEDIVLDYLPMAKSKRIEFYASPVAPELKVFADRLGLRRVLSNLVSNALKFTPEKGKVWLNAERRNSEVCISVSDTGAGISTRDRRLLFEKYGRLEKHRGVDGTGLGLYVSRNIVNAHGGTIEVNSEVDVGTTFMVTFPDPAADIEGRS
ncbi:MAG: response regulator [Deltaproteobacteria bacterium]|nr:response regulator [Deltaproteobacteria bacterium]